MDMSDFQFIDVLSLFDSQLPIGAFVFSWGIEAYAQDDFTEENIKEIMLSFINEGPLLLDLYTCKLSYISASSLEDIRSINDFYSACKYLPSAYEASITLGSNLIRVGRSIFALDLADTPPRTHFPVAMGIIGNKLRISLDILLLSFAHSNIKSILNSMVRCAPVSPFNLWSLLVGAKKELASCVKKALELKNPYGIYLNTFLWDMYIHKQQFLETRLFEG